MLTVTNTQANLELVAAFAESLRKNAPANVAHQLMIVEGPGELIRTINAAASRTADAGKELEMLLDYASKPGSNIRVVADAFMEGRHGVHSSTAAVREHFHATGLDLDAQSRPTTTWEMRPLGLSLAISSALGTDPDTLDESLKVEFHPAAPDLHQISVSEPLTGQLAGISTSDTSGVEFTTAITSSAGTTKLVGVTEPVGPQAQKADVLWAVFITNSVRHVEMLPSPPRSENTTPLPAGMEAATFLADEALFATLMEQDQQSLRHWMETAQGISFPTGSVLERRGQHLHVINTPAMIESIGALVTHARNTAPHTLSFTLLTLQAPASLLRDLTRKSMTASGDDTSMLAHLEAAVQRGDAMWIDTLHIDSQSGGRSICESVREHTHVSGFLINDKNVPEIEFDMRTTGSSLEVEAALLGDGHTVGLNVSHEIHSSGPEARSADFRDPVTGRPFAMPATDFHVLKANTSLQMIRGGIKLISLHKPTGRDTGGQLWATFLRSDVVPRSAKQLAIELTQKRQAPDAEGLETRTFKVPADFMGDAGAAFRESDPFDVTAPDPGHARKGILAHPGISFPKGASANFNPGESTLTIRNSPENLLRIKRLLEEIYNKGPKSIAVTMHVLQAPGPLLRRLAALAAQKSDHRGELDELLAAVRIGEAQALGTHRIETKAAVRATTQQGTESAGLSDLRIAKDGKTEILTESRNVGFKVEVEPSVEADGTTVEMNIACEFHTAPPLEHREHVIDTQGRRLEFPLTDYHVSKVSTCITIPDGTARLLSLYKPTGKPEFEKEDILQAIFITCDILRTGE
ncbi:MAG: hypothetical protein IAE77_20950 [Prosthecobacter sp.]|uniref:hypothetical protein n=1 Tax=Prosthecobacter sp. TaxID=1965333 RepID=UPI0019DE73D6|nr:hypothetical protein [Prosthecobacter sp.]MBE2285938.1 hypothetical protein [Prosthecobacter sp.]